MKKSKQKEIVNPVQQAIDIVGGQRKLAWKIGVAQQTISKWLKKGHVPFRNVQLVVNALEGKLSAAELCPDIKKALNLTCENYNTQTLRKP